MKVIGGQREVANQSTVGLEHSSVHRDGTGGPGDRGYCIVNGAVQQARCDHAGVDRKCIQDLVHRRREAAYK